MNFAIWDTIRHQQWPRVIYFNICATDALQVLSATVMLQRPAPRYRGLTPCGEPHNVMVTVMGWSQSIEHLLFRNFWQSTAHEMQCNHECKHEYNRFSFDSVIDCNSDLCDMWFEGMCDVAHGKNCSIWFMEGLLNRHLVSFVCILSHVLPNPDFASSRPSRLEALKSRTQIPSSRFQIVSSNTKPTHTKINTGIMIKSRDTLCSIRPPEHVKITPCWLIYHWYACISVSLKSVSMIVSYPYILNIYPYCGYIRIRYVLK